MSDSDDWKHFQLDNDSLQHHIDIGPLSQPLKKSPDMLHDNVDWQAAVWLVGNYEDAGQSHWLPCLSTVGPADQTEGYGWGWPGRRNWW